MHVIIVSFDDCDPTAFGPYASYAEAYAAKAAARATCGGDDNDSITSVDVILLRKVPA